MSGFSVSARHLRTLVVWAVVSAGAAGTVLLTAPTITAGPRGAFADLLTWGCAVAGLASAVGLWIVSTDVAVSVLAGRVSRRSAVGPVRALLLVACGVVVLGAPAAADAPAQSWLDVAAAAVNDTEGAADERRALAGLPLPDRTGVNTSPAPARLHPDAHTVQPGDSLWEIAEGRLGVRATVAEVASYVRTIHARNAGLVGPDPDLILPGQRLELPPTPERDSR